MQSLLSDNWHSVRWIKPRLRDGVRVFHRIFRGRPAVLLFDPSAHKYHQLSLEAWRVVECFDGVRTLDEIWSNAVLSESEQLEATQTSPVKQKHEQYDAIGQRELVQLISQLHAGDLLQSQVTPDAEEVFQRYDKQRKTKIKQIILNPLSIKLPLFYPEPWLKHQVKLASSIFSKYALLIWLSFIVPACLLALINWSELTENLSDRILSGQNLFIAWFTYPLIKAIHEWAHALAIKKWGGHVREAGVIFLVFAPVPYVDASDSYAFSNKWQRALVAAAGIMAELFIGSIAVFVWILAEPGAIRAVAYNIALIAGLSTLLINGNPLMRFDGYYVLSELLEIPNFAQRSTKYWAYLADKYLFKSSEAKSPAHSVGEQRAFIIYGAIAPIYRLIIALGLAWFVAEEYFIFGAIIAIVGVWTSLIKPFWSGWKHISTSPTLAGIHGVSIKRSAICVGAIVFLVGFLPLPFYAISEAVVWVPEQAEIRVESSGHIGASMVDSGYKLVQGDVIGVLENPTLQAELELARSEVDNLDIQLRKQEIQDIAKASAIRLELSAAKEKLIEAERKVSALALIAKENGHWIFVNGAVPAGQFFKRGETLGYLVNGPSKIIRVAVEQEDIDLVRTRAKSASVRMFRRPFYTYKALSFRPIASGQHQLVSPALGTAGGGRIAVDPAVQEGTKAIERVFDYEIDLTQSDPLAAFGDRALVRFDLGWAPLAQQFYLRLRQSFLSRLNL